MSAGKRVNELMRALEEEYQAVLERENLPDHTLTKLGLFYGLSVTMEEGLSHEDFDVRRMLRTALEHELARLVREIDVRSE